MFFNTKILAKPKWRGENMWLWGKIALEQEFFLHLYLMPFPIQIKALTSCPSRR